MSLTGKKEVGDRHCQPSRHLADLPDQQVVGIEDVGNGASFLVSNDAAALSGTIEHIDAGFHIPG